jgi:gamma-glutamylcyclotransferase (GGCT)/AIG2-like uncharacterized protein YtfP
MSRGPLQLFVYGTLRRGYANHGRYCQGVRAVQAASVPGRLYRLPSGYPALVLPERLILARAGHSVQRDLALLRRWNAASHPLPLSLLFENCYDGWVAGELLYFDDFEARLAALDDLEGFRRNGRGLYLRVLAPVRLSRSGGVRAAWTYVMPEAGNRGRLLTSGRWPG